MNNNYIDTVLDIIFENESSYFGITLDNDSDQDMYFDSRIEDALYNFDENIEVNFGMTKLVISSPKLNGYVIKIPFDGYRNCGTIYNYDECIEEEYEDWYSYYGAADGGDGSDYCKAELLKYLALQELGLEQFVAETLFYKEIEGRCILLQEKVKPAGSYDRTEVSAASKKRVEHLKENFIGCKFNNIWLGKCFDVYNDEAILRFIDYCENEDREIADDLHSGNYGYRADNTPCILDFSSFNDQQLDD